MPEWPPEPAPKAARAAGLRRLSRLTWRATQLSAVTAVGFATLFARTAPAQSTASDGTASPPCPRPRWRLPPLQVRPTASGRGPRRLPGPGGGTALRRRPGDASGQPDADRGPVQVGDARPALLFPGIGLADQRRPRPEADRLQRVARGRLMRATAEPSTLTFPALGTFATVLVTGPDALGPAHEVLAAELAAMDAACSRFRRDSELWRVNHARGRPVTVSPLFADALTVALDAAELTDGDVDPTCGQSLVRLGYDRDFALARRHTDPLRQPPMPAGGWRRVELDRCHPAVRVPAGNCST